MVKRSLLAALKGNRTTTIPGLCVESVGKAKTAKPTEPSSSKKTAPKQKPTTTAAPTARKKQRPQDSVVAARQTFAQPPPPNTPADPILARIYGAEHAHKKRHTYIDSNLEHVTNVEEAVDVCLFKAEQAQTEHQNNKRKLAQLEQSIRQLRAKKARLNEISKAEEEARVLRAKLTTARGSTQTTVDVLLNVAEFSRQQAKDSAKKDDKATEHKLAAATVQKTIGSFTLCQEMQSLLLEYVNTSKQNAADPKSNLPPLKYNANDPIATRIAKQVVRDDSVYRICWSLAESDIVDDYDDDDDDDDLFDDAKRDRWLAHNDDHSHPFVSASSNAAVSHKRAMDFAQCEKQRCSLRAKAAETVAANFVSLFFQEHGAPDDSTCSSAADKAAADHDAEQQRKLSASSTQKYSIITMGNTKESSAVGGKKRNRVANKFKPSRNQKNVSIMNFIEVKQQQLSEKQHNDAKCIEFLRDCERRRERALSGAASKAKSTSNADESKEKTEESAVATPNYSNPTCLKCGAAMHVSSRTNVETCTSAMCGNAVHRGIGFEIVHLEQMTHNSYQYLLEVHMKTTLRRVQAKESALIPERVLNAVRKQIEIQRMPMARVNPRRIKVFLRKLDLSPWYNHRSKICAIITGRKPHQFSADEENIILAIFERLIEPYNIYQTNKDENFPYYQYALHKILQLLGYPEHVLREFPILKERRNHLRKEAIWEKMMAHLGWPYYRS